MIEEPLVTVITVSYKSEKYIRDAIETVLAQNYRNLQYIIGDDCSPDNTWAIINEYHDPRIQRYRNATNLGEYPNRNKAIGLARGEYLIFIDGDDMIYPHAIAFMVKMMNAFTDCGYAISYRYRNNLFYPVNLSPVDFHRANFLSRGFNDTAFTNTFFRTRILKEENALPTHLMAGDTYIRLKIALKHHVLLINDGLTWWRETPGQASQRLRSNFRKDMDEYAHVNTEFIRSSLSPLTEEEKLIALDNIYYSVKRTMVKNLLSFRFGRVADLISVMQSNKIPFKALLKSNMKIIDVFEGYDTVHVKKEPLSHNPYAVSENVNEHAG